MKKYTTWIWVAIIVAVLMMWWPFSWPTMPSFDFSSSERKSQIDSLSAVIVEYQKANAELASTIITLEGQISDLQVDIKRRENAINKLKKETNEKSNTVVKFTTTDIYQFLSDRYKDSTSIK